MKKWELAPDTPGHLLQKYADPIRKMLFQRDLAVEDDAEKFLHPDYERDILDPFLFRDMEKAVVRIFEAMEAKEKIVVYSDYDCDGIPAATILSDLFKKIDYKNVEFYIPDRHDEGYGLHMDAVKGFAQNGVSLLVTLDLGTTAVDETAYAEANGINVIITDHHLGHGALPRPFALLNPHVPECGYPEAVLSGAGVGWKLVQAFTKKYGEYYKLGEGFEKWSLDMAALGTLSDMVPIKGENRAISFFGMKVIRKNRRPGLAALFENLKIDATVVSEEDLTFMICPRINAASRMDNPTRAFELLSSDTMAVARPLALHLSKINDDRKTFVARIMKEAKSTLGKRENESPIVVIGNTGWRAGILGLVAGKLTEETGRPCFVWGMEEGDDTVKGSCRSDGSVNVVELMTAAGDALVTFGGHAGAGGFVATKEKIHFLEATLSLQYENVKDKDATEKKETALMSLPLSSVTKTFITTMNELSPFGLDNPKPVFLFQNVTIVTARQFGKTKEHLEVIFEDETGTATTIAFFKNSASFQTELLSGKVVTLAGTLEISYFRGITARIRIVDIF